jgi:hypothetical protein
MEITVFDNVRTACRTVAERATHVRINYDRISDYAQTLPVRNAASPELDPRNHYLGHGEDTVAFILTLDTINFGSGYFPHLAKRPSMSGYFTMASSLNDYFKNHGPISANKLRNITIDDCAEIFNQDLNSRPIRELMDLFRAALNDLGTYLREDFNGSFVDLVESADASVNRLVGILIKMPYFKDVASYGNLEVPFYKRAQLTAADLALAFNGTGPGNFDDLDNLTIFADNLIPHVLRVDKILLYDKNLADRIDAGKLIPAGSPDEVEIRACALQAVELLKKDLRKAGDQVTSSGLDYLLWNRGQQPYYKSIPRHRTRTVFY